MKNRISYWLSIAAVGIALGLALQFVRAWTEPASDPPGGNLGAPINTSGTAQTKAGNLNINGGMLIGSSTTGGNKGAGTINADQVCIRGVCKTEWPSGSTTTTTTTTIAEPLCQCNVSGRVLSCGQEASDPDTSSCTTCYYVCSAGGTGSYYCTRTPEINPGLCT
ncbi:MAG: hypothetical protein WC858_02040 [Parcubacteria group bacterium]|jgi:hypothetical protein